MSCPRCGAELPADARVCGACHHLVHAAELTGLATRADAEEAAGDLSAALATVRSMIDLVPAGTRQAEALAGRATGLSTRIDAPATSPPEPAGKRKGLGAIAAAAAAFLWKGQALLLLALTKAKFLLLGLTKLPTLLSMLVSVAAYGALFGWRFAVGFVLSIYVHEIGHVVALQRYGIAATAPMFVPGLGAFVRLKQYPSSEAEDATVGLAGPIWGLGAALACSAVWLATGWPLFAALGRTGAWINLFNLMPVSQLDGGRGYRALDRPQRWLGVGALGVAWAVSGDAFVLFIAIVAAIRTMADKPSVTGNRRILVTYASVVAGLAVLLALVPDARVAP